MKKYLVRLTIAAAFLCASAFSALAEPIVTPEFEKAVEVAAAKATEIRHIVHRDPELSWQEVRTTALYASELEKAGIKILQVGFKGTESGIVAEIEGAFPGPTLAIRADIDALPVQENRSYKIVSENDGIMHACGHDAHGAGLLGTALAVNQLRDKLHGKIRFIFQPAEESGFDPGAKAMIAEGALDGVDAIIGTHVSGSLAKGKVGWKNGAFAASADFWEIVVTGKGGHGGFPHTAINPNLCMASMIPAIENIVSAEVPASELVVVTVASLESGNRPNVIPEKCRATGNVRTSNREIRASMPERFERIAKNIAAAWRCTAEVKYSQLIPVMVNDDNIMGWIREAVSDAGMGDTLEERPFGMASEDFSFYGDVLPAAFIYFGMGTGFPNHAANFIVDDDVMPLSVRVQTLLALDYGISHPKD